ncbi:MAG: CheR family methyltransferase, partial [Prolixibacteraceae bacterium]
MPENCGMAFVVIQHLDPKNIGIMVELLQRVTNMQVFQAKENHKISQDCIYIIPPNKVMSTKGGMLHLFERSQSRILHLPIDVFFRSMAEDLRGKSIGVILSGMGSDGSLGLKAIKEKYGIVLVQSPETAKFDGMPRSAIEAVVADIVAPATDLPARLIEFLKFAPNALSATKLDDKTIGYLNKIVILLREQLGHDFSQYKKNTILRRIERRQSLHLIESMGNYVRFCQENPGEIDVLFKELLIGVTSFFRDPELWEKLKNEILPELLSELPYGYELRVWVAACSTGEETYSLAIIIKEILEKSRNPNSLSFKIFATDIDGEALEIARIGLYSANISSDVSPERLSKFFTADLGGYHVKSTIREMCVFAAHNIIKHPPFIRLDLLFCRNMLIYMEPVLQLKVFRLFNFILNPGGIMVIGTAETLDSQGYGFNVLDGKLKIFKRNLTSKFALVNNFSSSSDQKRAVRLDKKIPNAGLSLTSLADQILIQRFAPSSVLLSKQGVILYMTGRIGKYIELVPGEPNWNINDLAREGLRQILPAAFQKAMRSFEPITFRNVKIVLNADFHYADVTLQRLDTPIALKGMFMLVFTEIQEYNLTDSLIVETVKPNLGFLEKELRTELQHKEEELQGLLEEMRATEEEMTSTNEELQSANEELQASNEELNTSKEEMQSINEELQTVNYEMKHLIGDYQLASTDMENLLNSIEIAILFLDKELNIRRFTESITTLYKMRSSDIGRPFTDMNNDLKYPELFLHSQQVLKTQVEIVNSVSTKDGRWFSVKIMPYITNVNQIDGVVITFIDITLAKNLELALEEKNRILVDSERSFRFLFESAKDGILILEASTGKIMMVNPFLEELLGYSKEQLLDKSIWEIGSLKDLVANKSMLQEIQVKKYVRYNNLPLETVNGKRINVEFISNTYMLASAEVI